MLGLCKKCKKKKKGLLIGNIISTGYNQCWRYVQPQKCAKSKDWNNKRYPPRSSINRWRKVIDGIGRTKKWSVCFILFYFFLPVGLFEERPPSSWGLHASICLCRCTASAECAAFPRPPSPELPLRLSTWPSGPLEPSRILLSWTTSTPLLGLLWDSVRGGTSSLTEGWRDVPGSSSSGIGLYQISPSSSASFSSAGSTLRGWGDTLAWPIVT